MNRTALKSRIVPLALTGLTAGTIASGWSSTPANASAAKTRTFTGLVAQVDHGPVQVSILVRNHKITGVKVANSPQEGRSFVIQSGAIPVLKQETLHAQSARINEVSGATDTSGGYIASLQNAIKKAEKAKALK